jgi:phosphoribosylpyrophosphate synthetase
MLEVQNGAPHYFHKPFSHFINRVTTIADKLGIEFALIHRQRNGKADNAPERMDILVGDVRGKVKPNYVVS